ncbi:MAG: CatA-like O-acetyltransferase [Thermoanaerobaculales bacterium]
MAYTVVEKYYRQKHFNFFSGYGTPFYSLTLEFEISRLKAFAEDNGYPVYLSLCYFFTRGIQPLEDFRYRVMADRIVLYDRLDFAATLPAPDRLFSFAYFEYGPNVAAFFRRVESAMPAMSGVATLAEPTDSNHLLFTALPGVPFTGFAHAKPSSGADARPRVAFGKFRADGDRLLVPVGLDVNHIFIDGAALGDLVEGVQDAFEIPED